MALKLWTCWDGYVPLAATCESGVLLPATYLTPDAVVQVATGAAAGQYFAIGSLAPETEWTGYDEGTWVAVTAAAAGIGTGGGEPGEGTDGGWLACPGGGVTTNGDGAPVCGSGTWTFVEPFSLELLEPTLSSGYFAAGFMVVVMFWVIGKGVEVVLEQIRR